MHFEGSVSSIPAKIPRPNFTRSWNIVRKFQLIRTISGRTRSLPKKQNENNESITTSIKTKINRLSKCFNCIEKYVSKRGDSKLKTKSFNETVTVKIDKFEKFYASFDIDYDRLCDMSAEAVLRRCALRVSSDLERFWKCRLFRITTQKINEIP